MKEDLNPNLVDVEILRLLRCVRLSVEKGHYGTAGDCLDLTQALIATAAHLRDADRGWGSSYSQRDDTFEDLG